MRFLKNKIRLAEEAFQRRQELLGSPSSTSTAASSIALSPASSDKKRRQRKPNTNNSASANPTKNVIINFGKAIASFASSSLAVPYIQSYVKEGQVDFKGFGEFIAPRKSSIGGIESFRTLLITQNGDNEEVQMFKQIFKMLSEVFIKYFSVNWIIHGKVTQKTVYLKYRHCMMRRIQNPEHFTNIKGRKTCN